jgi:hypothetical protein
MKRISDDTSAQASFEYERLCCFPDEGDHGNPKFFIASRKMRISIVVRKRDPCAGRTAAELEMGATMVTASIAPIESCITGRANSCAALRARENVFQDARVKNTRNAQRRSQDPPTFQ